MLCYRRRNAGRSGAVLGGVLEPPSPRTPPVPLNQQRASRQLLGRSGAVLGGVLEPPSPRIPPVPLNQQRASRQLLGRSGAVLGGVLEPPSPRIPPVPLNTFAVNNRKLAIMLCEQQQATAHHRPLSRAVTRRGSV